MKKDTKFSKVTLAETEKVAKLITLNCIRDLIEDLHSGKVPISKTGDYSDVKVVTPEREIPWNELLRITDEEIKMLNREIVNKVFTFLLYFQKEGIPKSVDFFGLPADWDPPEIDAEIKGIWDISARLEGK